MDRNLFYGDDLTFADGSLSARRAWIEIKKVLTSMYTYGMSLSARRAWIEILMKCQVKKFSGLSLSARRAWIEIVYPGTWSGSILVALRKESVDRNARRLALSWAVSVALRKESVDRNRLILLLRVLQIWSLSARRAWIEIQIGHQQPDQTESLSARRAWIEIVAEGFEIQSDGSLSARRAWIEMQISVTTVVGVLGRSPQGERG